MARPNLSSCYQKIGSLQDKLQNLQERFGSSGVTRAIHSAQIDLQQVPHNGSSAFSSSVLAQMFLEPLGLADSRLP